MKRLLAAVDDEVVDVIVCAATCVYFTLGDTFLTEVHIFLVFQVQMSVYFLGHIFFIVAFLSLPYLRKLFVPKKERGQLKQD